MSTLAGDAHAPIWEMFEAICRQHPAKRAVDDGTRSLSFAALRDAALSVAHRLSHDVPPGGLVAIVLRHSACHAVGVLACLAGGHPCMALDAFHPAARNARAIADSRAGAALLDRLAPGQLPPLPPSCARLDMDGAVAAPAAFRPTPAATDAPAFVISTSGSTGAPKGIVLSQGNMLHQVAQDSQTCRLTSDDQFLPLGSPAAISPLRGLLSALLSGGTLHLRDLHDGFAPLFATMRDKRLTVSRIGPSLLRTLVALPGAKDAFHAMRIVRVGGEALSGQDVARMRAVLPASCTLVFAYGSTEIPPVIERLIPAHAPLEDGTLHIGRPLPGSELALVDEHGALVPDGEPGELVVRGPHLALGYWSAGTCVPGDIMPDTDTPGHRSFRSGDILRRRADGTWEFVSRADHQMKIRGNRAEPGETEATLRAMPGVADAVVLASGDGDAASLTAFIVPDHPADAAAFVASLRAALSECLPDHLRPSDIRLLDTIPRLTTFKPDAAALRAMPKGPRHAVG